MLLLHYCWRFCVCCLHFSLYDPSLFTHTSVPAAPSPECFYSIFQLPQMDIKMFIGEIVHGSLLNIWTRKTFGIWPKKLQFGRNPIRGKRTLNFTHSFSEVVQRSGKKNPVFAQKIPDWFQTLTKIKERFCRVSCKVILLWAGNHINDSIKQAECRKWFWGNWNTSSPRFQCFEGSVKCLLLDDDGEISSDFPFLTCSKLICFSHKIWLPNWPNVRRQLCQMRRLPFSWPWRWPQHLEDTQTLVAGFFLHLTTIISTTRSRTWPDNGAPNNANNKYCIWQMCNLLKKVPTFMLISTSEQISANDFWSSELIKYLLFPLGGAVILKPRTPCAGVRGAHGRAKVDLPCAPLSRVAGQWSLKVFALCLNDTITNAAVSQKPSSI